MMELLLIRHSITMGNELKQYIGSTDQPLTENGITLAQKACLSMPSIDGLWVSPMLRCRQTADILFPGQSQTAASDLRECDFGQYEEKTWENLKDDPTYRRWISGEAGIVPPGGEDRMEFMKRSAAAVKRVAEEAASRGLSRPAIVSHGGVLMSAMAEYALPRREFYAWQPRNCGGYLVEVEDGPLSFRVLKEI